jgi:hypothetical protein
MKLVIKRDQKAQAGLLGATKEWFSAQLPCRLNTVGAGSGEKYKAEMHPLTFTTDREDNKIPNDTVSSLMRVWQEMKDITPLLNNEEVIKEACKGFKTLLDVMATLVAKKSLSSEIYLLKGGNDYGNLQNL